MQSVSCHLSKSGWVCYGMAEAVASRQHGVCGTKKQKNKLQTRFLRSADVSSAGRHLLSHALLFRH